MKKMAWTTMLCLVLAVGAEAAKEKANRSKCRSKLERIGALGVAQIEQTAALLLPAVQKLRAAGNNDGAMQLTDNAVRRIQIRGHVTVLKINQTADTCVAKLEREGADAKTILGVQAARDAARLAVRDAERAAVDSFFDIWTEV